MKNKKKYIDINLIIEGMRMNKTLGLVALVLSIVSTVLWTLWANVGRVYSSNRLLHGIHFMLINPFILGLLAFAPFFTLGVFGFQNRRNASDFYHVVPHKRQCIFISFLTSVFAWEFGIITISSLAGLFTTVFTDIKVLPATIIPSMVTVLIACMLVSSAAAFAMSVTGNLVSNIFATLMLLFVPRLLVIVFNIMLCDSLSFVVIDDEQIFSGFRYNLLFEFMGAMFETGNSATNVFQDIYAMLYTFGLALVYFIAGLFCFTRRKSESTQKASVSRAMQCFLRVVPAMIVSLIPVSILFDRYVNSRGVVNGYSYTPDNFTVFVFYVITVIVYFLYELITTRKLKNLLYAIPGLLIVLVLNLLFYFGLITAFDNVLYQVPQKTEVAGVNISKESGDSFFWIYAGEVEISDEDIVESSIRALDEQIKLFDKDRIAFNNKYYRSNSRVVITYNYKNGHTLKRRVAIDDGLFKRISDYLIGSGEMDKAYNLLLNAAQRDEYDYSSSVLDAPYVLYNIYGLDSGEQQKAVFDAFAAEIKDIGMKNGAVTGQNSFFSVNLQVCGKDGGKDYCYYDVDRSLPNTVATFMNIKNMNYGSDPLEGFLDSYKYFSENSLEDYDQFDSGLSLTFCKPDGNDYAWDYVYLYCTSGNSDEYRYGISDEQLEALKQLYELCECREILSEDISGDAYILQADWNFYSYINDYYDYYDKYPAVSDAEISEESATISINGNEYVERYYIISPENVELFDSLFRIIAQ